MHTILDIEDSSDSPPPSHSTIAAKTKTANKTPTSESTKTTEPPHAAAPPEIAKVSKVRSTVEGSGIIHPLVCVRRRSLDPKIRSTVTRGLIPRL